MGRYLVTGAAGFIAARVCEMLLDGGHAVFGVDNLNDAYDPRIKTHRLGRLSDREGFAFRQIDISDRAAVTALADGDPFEAVINLAARAGVRASVLDPWVYLETNTTGTLNLLELCRHNGIPKFILASTSSIYGADAPLPTPETADSSTPLQPYAASKKGAEAMAHAYHYLFGIDVSVVRFFTVYGPAGRPDMSVFRFIRWIAEGEPLILNGDGTQSRGFTYVDDIARGVILGLKPVGHEIFNLGGHENVTMNELIAMIEKGVGKKARIENRPFPQADMTVNLADISKAGRLLGWEPQVRLEEGLRRTIAWYLEEREWASRLDVGG
ncbi:MAG TPA: NAD-dependent epimerase/dehydratase family protein [Anaerolineales bacterium]|nr:NAD-dependent epimerase/dehydratase family protein [Anaerolineales bacterium]